MAPMKMALMSITAIDYSQGEFAGREVASQMKSITDIEGETITMPSKSKEYVAYLKGFTRGLNQELAAKFPNSATIIYFEQIGGNQNGKCLYCARLSAS